MQRLGAWTARGLSRLRGIEIGPQRIAAVMGISAFAILAAGLIEAVATAVFYGSVAVAVVYIVLQWIQKAGGTA